MPDQSMNLHELKRAISARDKAVIAGKPFAEAVKYLKERYKISEDSAASFAVWQRSIASGGESDRPSNPNERWHLKFDEDQGLWIKIPQPGDPNYEATGASPGETAAVEEEEEEVEAPRREPPKPQKRRGG